MCVGEVDDDDDDDDDEVATARRMADRALSMIVANIAGNSEDNADETMPAFQFIIAKLLGGKMRVVLATVDDTELELNDATLEPMTVTTYTTMLLP